MRRAVRALVVGILVLMALAAVAVVAMVRRDVPVAELVARYAPPPSQFAEIEGMRVHYRVEGTGPTLVLLHGTSSSLHTWDGWVRELSDTRRIVRLDLPGFGLTGPAPDDDYRAERHARVVAALLDRLGVTRADVAGNSLGGRVAITFALAHPDRVRRLILIDAAGFAAVKPPAVFALARVPVLRNALRFLTPEVLVRKNVEQVYGEPSRVTDATVERYHALTLRAGNRGATIARLDGPVDPVLADRLGALRMPVLIEWGARDRWIPVAHAHGFHRAIAGAELRIYPDAGHVPMEELPEVTARDADAFLGTEN
jgi:pimeloyl-ACP methyl ester carboxylesterase